MEFCENLVASPKHMVNTAEAKVVHENFLNVSTSPYYPALPLPLEDTVLYKFEQCLPVRMFFLCVQKWYPKFCNVRLPRQIETLKSNEVVVNIPQNSAFERISICNTKLICFIPFAETSFHCVQDGRNLHRRHFKTRLESFTCKVFWFTASSRSRFGRRATCILQGTCSFDFESAFA